VAAAGGMKNTLKSFDLCWLPPRDSNPDMLIQSQQSYCFCLSENK
jgi:hypothetical protein